MMEVSWPPSTVIVTYVCHGTSCCNNSGNKSSSLSSTESQTESESNASGSSVTAIKKNIEPVTVAGEPENHSSYPTRRNIMTDSVFPLKRKV